MQIKFFAIPLMAGAEEVETLNRFLRSVKVLEIDKQLVTIGTSAYWSFCVSYFPVGQGDFLPTNTKKIDYKEVLKDTDFQKFCQLRKIRKQLADDDAVPAFAVFTDYELSEIAQSEEVSLGSLGKIKGIGVKKLEKYGKKLCELYANLRSDETDSGTLSADF